MTIIDFAKRIIEGVGGMNDYEHYEKAVWRHSERVEAAMWAIKCLANPECEGSDTAIDAILARREETNNKLKQRDGAARVPTVGDRSPSAPPTGEPGK